MLKGDNWLEIVCKCQGEITNLVKGDEYFRTVRTVSDEYKSYNDVVSVKIFPKEATCFREYMVTTFSDEYDNEYYVFVQTKSDPTYWCGLSRKSAESFLRKEK